MSIRSRGAPVGDVRLCTPSGGFLGGHGNAGAVDGRVELVRQRRGRQRHQFSRDGGTTGLGRPLGPPGGQVDPRPVPPAGARPARTARPRRPCRSSRPGPATSTSPPFNVARDASQIGVQGNNADVDTIIFGGVQLTAGPDALPEDTYRAGVNNLLSGNPPAARTLIWDAMMRDHAHSEVVFHWLIAMLSGRTITQFPTDEKDQLRRARSRFALAGTRAMGGRHPAHPPAPRHGTVTGQGRVRPSDRHDQHAGLDPPFTAGPPFDQPVECALCSIVLRAGQVLP